MRKAVNSVSKKVGSQKVVFAIAFALLLLYAAYVLFFFYFAIVCALKPNNDAYMVDKLSKQLVNWTAPPNFKNFFEAFDQLQIVLRGYTFSVMTWNSIWRTVTSSVLSIASSTMVCYVLVFYRSKLTKFIYNLGIFVSLFPVYGAAGGGRGYY